ncbi:acyltransferase [Runella sp. SP2]|uniref:acyltransferase n=1 Tax=Runella sp. SP2 TaxID=2268026 RepID=UPI000F07DFDD|nr:acyltransferase [Runella sp. SP2]AYQ31762.1 acyltransferase [Runella sp. SP2]
MIIFIIYKSIRRAWKYLRAIIDKLYFIFLFKGNKVIYANFKCIGTPYVMVAKGGSFSIGKNFSMNNGISGNPIGCYDRCTFFVDRGAKLSIGDNVGMSQAALICHQSITIGNYVKIGGGVKIYDTDFHSLNPVIRASKNDLIHKVKAPVVVKDNVFIGAFTIILKGVTIGQNSIIGAGSVVTKSVPDNQVWAGNPARFIRAL